MKNILNKFLVAYDAGVDQAFDRSLATSSGCKKEGHDITKTCRKKALLGVVADAGDISPRYGKHWVEHPMKGLL